MKKAKRAFYALGMIVAVSAFAFFGTFMKGSEKVIASATTTKTYSTRASIAEQGENGFYYAWGKPDEYVLMTYGAVAGGGYSWRGVEPYQTANGNALHPGTYWGTLTVWVANESGTVQLTGSMEKGTTVGDGVHLGVYYQSYGGELSAFMEQFVTSDGVLKYSLDKTVEVNKGDTFLFYCDSGKAKDNSSDSVDCSFTITYTQVSGDYVNNEDLSTYLNVVTPTELAGFEHIEQEHQAEILDGTLTEKVTQQGGCSSSVSALTFMPLAIIPLLFIRRRKR